MKLIRLSALVFVILALAACKREATLTLLMQNQHPGIASTEIQVSFVPRGSGGSAGEKILWTASIPYSKDAGLVHTKKIPLTGAGIPPDTDCCVRIALSLKGEVYSDGNGSWKPGENFEHITIQNENGIYVRKEGSSSLPEKLSDSKMVPLD